MLMAVAVAASSLLVAHSQVPSGPAVWQMNLSTIIMPCNYTGPTDPQSTKGWGTIDFDWSNWKGTGAADGWAKAKPMDCEERLATQVAMTTAASPSTKVWVYRNSILALPWCEFLSPPPVRPDTGKTLQKPCCHPPP